MYQTVFFDLDGTLINSGEGITEGVRVALEAFGLPPLPYEVREKFVGPPLRASFVKYCDVTEEMAEKLLAEYRRYYAERGIHQCVPYDGVRTLLEELQERGRELFVVTAKPTSYSRTILEEWKLSGYFKEIVGASFDKKMDKKEQIVRATMDMTKSDNIIMVGDTVYDVEGARANGLPTIGVLYGFGDHAALRASKPEFLVETVEEIGGIV